MFNSGFIESGFDPKDIILDNEIEAKSASLPTEYDFAKFMSLYPKDQGRTYTCVPYTVSQMLECRKKLDDANSTFELDINDIYNSRPEPTNGMCMRDALDYIKYTGFKGKKEDDREKILLYGRLTSQHAIKMSVFMNGPCMMGLPVYDSTRAQFWNGNKFEGAHAIACVGYDEYGFILLNSWGQQWGDFGMCKLPYEDTNKILECWTLITK